MHTMGAPKQRQSQAKVSRLYIRPLLVGNVKLKIASNRRSRDLMTVVVVVREHNINGVPRKDCAT